MDQGPSPHWWLHSRTPLGILCDRFWGGKPYLPLGILGSSSAGSRSLAARLRLLHLTDPSHTDPHPPFFLLGGASSLYLNWLPLGGAFSGVLSGPSTSLPWALWTPYILLWYLFTHTFFLPCQLVYHCRPPSSYHCPCGGPSLLPKG